MNAIEPSAQLGWVVSAGNGLGYRVIVFDLKDPQALHLVLDSDDIHDLQSYSTPETARLAAVNRLRKLAERIERGEQ